MSNIVSVLVIVDVEGALAEIAGGSGGNITNNVYMVDTNKHFGSGNEGQAELKTAIKNGQLIKWRVASVAPENQISITGFTGQAVGDRIIQPEHTGFGNDKFWEAQVQSQGDTGQYQYSIQLEMGGADAWFDPFLLIS